MPTVSHATLTGTSLHEPKGVAAAAANTAYIANGDGVTGVWKKTPTQGLSGVASNGTSGQMVVVDGAGGFTLGGALFAELYITAGVTTQALTASAARLDPGTEWASGLLNGLAVTAADGTITLAAGVYEINFWASFDSDAVASGTLYTFNYALDGVLAARTIAIQKLTAGVDRLNVSAAGFVTATAGQVLSVYAKSSINSTITVVDAGFTAIRIKA